jgi:hypothetical protein
VVRGLVEAGAAGRYGCPRAAKDDERLLTASRRMLAG